MEAYSKKGFDRSVNGGWGVAGPVIVNDCVLSTKV